MVIDHHIERKPPKGVIVVRLGVHNDPAVEPGRIRLCQSGDIGAQQPDHGQVVRPFDHVDAANVDRGDFAPQQTLYRHGTGNGVRVGVDQDQNPIFSGKDVIKTAQALCI